MDTRKKENQEVVLLNLFDIDGCLYWPYGNGNDGTEINPEQWIIEQNKLLLKHVQTQTHTLNPKKVIVGYGTNRQSYLVNKRNSYRGDLSHLLYP